MLNNLKYEEYKKAVGTKFEVVEPSFEIVLKQISERQISERQEIFSLIFVGGKEKFLEQKIYQLHHSELGDGEIFFVPIAENANEFQYEAGFNRLID